MNPRVAAVVVLLLAVLSAVWWRMRSPADEGLVASGTVESTEAHLAFRVAGRIAELAVEEGDRVSAGDTLARLESAELRAIRDGAAAQLAQARARLTEAERGPRPEERAQAEAGLRAAREQLADAERESERIRRLHEGGALPRQRLDAARTAVEVARAARDQAEEAWRLATRGTRTEQVAQARAAVDRAIAELARADAVLADAVLVAPFSGVVSVRYRYRGEVVAPGAPVLALLDPGDRWVRVYVPGDRLGRVQLGQSAAIRSDTWPDRRYAGRVVSIADQAEFTPRNVQTQEERARLVYAVKVRIEGDSAQELKAGLPADVVLDADRPT